jgi:hypothetical protein
MNERELHEQRVLAGIERWDRRTALGRIEDASSFMVSLSRAGEGWRAEVVDAGAGFLTEDHRSAEGDTPDEALIALSAHLLTERKSRVVSKSKTKTAGYIQTAMESLGRAMRATGHRKMEAKHPIAKALNRALEACKEAHDQCHVAGEAYETEEE